MNQSLPSSSMEKRLGRRRKRSIPSPSHKGRGGQYASRTTVMEQTENLAARRPDAGRNPEDAAENDDRREVAIPLGRT